MNTLAILALVAALAITPSYSADVEWGYAGQRGPEYWYKLSKDFELCKKGKEQSPVDLAAQTVKLTNQGAPQYKWCMVPSAKAVHNGHSINVEIPKGQTLTWNGKTYELQQFHFHTPSEHRLRNAFLDLELHFVSKQIDGPGLLVSGVKFEIDDHDDPFLGSFGYDMPLNKGDSAPVQNIDLPTILKDTGNFREHYTYEGSLTVPPCTEGVHWVVAKNPLSISPKLLRHLRKGLAYNARLINVAAGESADEKRTFLKRMKKNKKKNKKANKQ